jgi:hypothetical protein
VQPRRDPVDGWFLVLLGAISAVAAAFLLVVTARWGLGVTPDSVSYLDAARNVRHGDGLTHTADQPLLAAVVHKHAPYPLLFWAPFYPVVLAATSIGPWGLLEAARLLNVLLFAATVALVGLLVLRTTGSRTGALIAAGVLAISPVGLELYSEVLSESLFLFLSYVAIALMAFYLSAERRLFFWGAAVATALALVTRFAGVPLLGATVLPLLVFGRGGWRLRLGRAAAFAGVSVLPLVAWLARNWHLTGTTTGRHLAWHPISVNRLAHGVDELTMLIVPPGVPAVMRGPLALIIVVAVLAAGTRLSPSHSPRGFSYYLLTSLLLYIVLYPIFLLGSISFLDTETNLSHRFLFPMYPGMVVLASWVLVTAFRSSSVTRVWRIALVVGIAAFICGNAVAMAVTGQKTRRDGLDYTARVWRSSPAIARIQTLPTSAAIYSDRPELIYFLTHRVARSVPATTNPMSGQSNSELPAEIRTLRRGLTRRDVVVLFAARRWYLEDAASLEKELRLVLTSRTADASFYRKRAR